MAVEFAGLPRETNDGCFDAANANKSCVRVHAGKSSEFPIYPTTRERGISIEATCTPESRMTYVCGIQFMAAFTPLSNTIYIFNRGFKV